MIKPKNKQDLIDMLRSKTFKVLMVEEDEAKKLVEQMKKHLTSKINPKKNDRIFVIAEGKVLDVNQVKPEVIK